MIFGGTVLVGINLLMAYIMFAPDDFPKPFYLMYAGESIPPAAAGVLPEDTNLLPGNAQAADVTPEVEPTPVLQRGQGFMVDTGTKIINLVDQTGRKYLRVGVVLEFAPPDPAYFSMVEEEKAAYLTTFNENMELKLPVINDIIITLLSSQTFESVYTAEGKEMIRKKQDINPMKTNKKVKIIFLKVWQLVCV